MSNEKRLGRGLEALLGGIGKFSELEQVHTTEPLQTQTNDQTCCNSISITKIEPNPYQPRKVFDEAELEHLAQSIQMQGLLSPIALRQVGERYQIIAGERRFRAVLRLGWSEIPAQILTADDQKMAELALTENIQRKDLNAIEKAASFANYLETYGGTHDELAKRLEIDRSTVSNLLRLLSLPQQIQDAVCQEQITPGHVRALLKLEPWEQVEIAAKIQAEGWSVRETERFAQELIQTGQAVLPPRGDQPRGDQPWHVVGEDGKSRAVSKQNEHIRQMEDEFRHYLGAVKVKLMQTNEKGKGKLIISFNNHAEFEHIYNVIRKPGSAAG